MVEGRRRRAFRAAGLCALVLASAAPVRAQAWVPPDGQGSVAVVYHFLYSGTHLNRFGAPNTNLGSERLHVVSIEGEYGITDRLTIDGSLAWLATSWTGPHGKEHGPLDTGIYHGALQDCRVAARYQLVDGRSAVTPFVAVVLPTHDYETRGHSAFGRDLRELHIGLNAGHNFMLLGRGAYVHANADYGFAQRAPDAPFNLNRLNGTFELGYSATSRIAGRGFGIWQTMQDGLLSPLPEDSPYHEDHDRLTRASYLQLGGGASVGLSTRITLVVDAFTTVRGRNLHSMTGIVTALSWRFGGTLHVTQ
jgi:hypothetical protein